MRIPRTPLHYIVVVLLALVCIAIGGIVTGVLGLRYNIPTPGMYAMRLIPDTRAQTQWLAPLIPRLVVAGFVNVVCCFVIIRALAALAKRAFNSPW